MKLKMLSVLAFLTLALPGLAMGQMIMDLAPSQSRVPGMKRAVIQKKMHSAKSEHIAKRLRCRGRELPGGMGPMTGLDGGGLPSPGARPRFSPVRIIHHSIKIIIHDGVVITDVEQIFFNPNGSILEGTYRCPLPKGAVVDRFSIWMNKKEVRAEAMAKAKARKIYEDIIRKVLDPGLVELEDGGVPVVKVRIFPIPGRGNFRVRMRTLHVLQSAFDGEFRTDYPIANLGATTDHPIQYLEYQVQANSFAPIQSAHCANARVKTGMRGEHRAVAFYRAKDVVPQKDFSFRYKPAYKNFEVSVTTFGKSPGEGFFVALLCPGERELRSPALSMRGMKTESLFPRRLPSKLLPGRRYVVLGRYSEGTADPYAELTGIRNNRKAHTLSPVSLDGSARTGDYMPGLWAGNKVRTIEKWVSRNGFSPASRDKILRLARTYGILTKRTALLAK